MEDSPMPNKDGRTSERNKNSPSLIQQLTLLYQLEQRKVTKLQNENQSLRERISNLLSKQDDERIGLLVADKTKRKLIQLRAITERTIKSLESGLKEFRSFVEDIDDAVEKQEHNGTLTPAKMDGNLSVLNSVIVHTPVHERLSKKFQPMLKRIPESPMIQKNLTARRRAMIHQIEEQEFDAIDKNETVEESHLFDYQQMEYSGRSCDKEQQQSMQEHSDENKVIEQENNNSHERTQIEEIVNSSSNVGGRTLEEQEEIDKKILSNTYNDSTIDETVNEDELKESKIVFKSTCNNSTIDETVNEDELIMNITMMTTASDAVAASQPRQRRAAATKVTSYKLPALNKKMRREE